MSYYADMILSPSELKIRRTVLQLLPFIGAIWVAACCSSWASEQRLLQFRFGVSQTITYDLQTVQKIQPGRFAIIATTIDDPDVIQFKLKALNIARDYCNRPPGHYPIPNALLTLGSPDMSPRDIKVISDSKKTVMLFYPYKRLMVGTDRGGQVFNCGRPSEFIENKRAITDGLREKFLFDCERGLYGEFLDERDDPATALTQMVSVGTWGASLYEAICRAVTHKEPYMPNGQ